jgi:hypothetical protein
MASLETNAHETRTDLDSHADSPVVGRNARIIEDLNVKVKVTGFSKSLGSTTVPLVNAIVAYDDIYLGHTYLFKIHNALCVKEMDHNLIPPFMMRLAQLQVDEVPKFMTPCPTIENHSIYCSRNEYRIPLQLHGIISFFPTRLPTDEEIREIPISIELTPPTPSWDPHSTSYSQQESNMMDYKGDIVPPSKRHYYEDPPTSQASVVNSHMSTTSHFGISSVSLQVSYAIEPWSLAATLNALPMIGAVNSGERRSPISPEELSRVFNIDINTAKSTIQSTTQRLIRSMENPTLHQRYSTNDRMLRYDRIQCPVYTDTYFATSKLGPSIRGFTCSQLFATDFGYVDCRHMKRKAEVPQAFKTFFREVGIPEALVADGASEQISGESKRICQLSDCDVRQLERGTPWANRAELNIGITKQKIKKQMKISGSPMTLW